MYTPLWLPLYMEDHGDDDEFVPELKQLVIKTVSKAEELAEQQEDFAQFYVHEELSLALSKLSNLLHQINLRNSNSQTSTITDFFHVTLNGISKLLIDEKGACLMNIFWRGELLSTCTCKYFCYIYFTLLLL